MQCTIFIACSNDSWAAFAKDDRSDDIAALVTSNTVFFFTTSVAVAVFERYSLSNLAIMLKFPRLETGFSIRICEAKLDADKCFGNHNVCVGHLCSLILKLNDNCYKCRRACHANCSCDGRQKGSKNCWQFNFPQCVLSKSDPAFLRFVEAIVDNGCNDMVQIEVGDKEKHSVQPVSSALRSVAHFIPVVDSAPTMQ